MSENIVNKINVNGKEYELQSKIEADGKGSVLGITVGSGLDTAINNNRLEIHLNLSNLVTNKNNRKAYVDTVLDESALRGLLDDVYLTTDASNIQFDESALRGVLDDVYLTTSASNIQFDESALRRALDDVYLTTSASVQLDESTLRGVLDGVYLTTGASNIDPLNDTSKFRLKLDNVYLTTSMSNLELSTSTFPGSPLKEALDAEYLALNHFIPGPGIYFDHNKDSDNKIEINPKNFKGTRKNGDSCEIYTGTGLVLNSEDEGLYSIGLDIQGVSIKGGGAKINLGNGLNFYNNNFIRIGTNSVRLGFGREYGTVLGDGSVINLGIGSGFKYNSDRNTLNLDLHEDDFYIDDDGKIRIKK